MLVFNKDFGLGTMSDQGGGAVINNQDMTITTNGEYTAESGYTGIGTATVNVPEADVITALNNTSDSISSGDKVWINKQAAYDANFTVLGNLTIDETTDIVSGFSSGSYIRLTNTFSPGNNPWEVVIKFKPNSVHSGGLMNKISSGQDFGFRIQTTTNGKMYYLISSSSGNTFLFEGEGSNSYVINQWNWVKFEFTGSAYNAYISSDGENWTLDKTYTSSTKLYSFNADTNIGNHPSKSYILDGEIDLSASYIKINNTDWWVPSITKIADYKLVNFYQQDYSYNDLSFVGSPTIDDGVASNFSSSSYIQSPRRLFGVSDYTFYIKFDSGELTSGTECLIEGTSSISKYGSYLRAWNGSSNVNILAFNTNTVYWMKVVVSGTTRTFYYSTDGINYTQCYTGTFYIREFRIDSIGYYSAAWSGNIDLKEMYLRNTSGEIVWSAVSDNTITGVAKESIASGSTGQVETVLPE